VTGQVATTQYDNGNVTGTATINWNNSNIQTLTLTGNTTLTFSNPLSGGIYTLQITQGGAGSYTITWPGSVIWPSGVAPTLSIAVGAVDFISFKYAPSSYYGFPPASTATVPAYETGTWTMGIAFGGNSTGMTLSQTAGSYTKIGRQVTVTGYLQLTAKGSSTGDATLKGLPYVVNNSFASWGSPSMRTANITYTGMLQGDGGTNTTTISFTQVTEAGAITSSTHNNFANNSSVILTFTYFTTA
jgi:hypothetical protein